MRKWNYLRIMHSIVVGFSIYILIGSFFLNWHIPTEEPEKLHFEGTYSLGGASFQPLDHSVNLNANRGELILRGNFLQENGDVGMPAGKNLHFYINHIDVQIYVNGELLFDAGIRKAMDSDVDVDHLCGAMWKSIPITEDISAEDQVEVRLSNIHARINQGAYMNWLDQLYYATEPAFENYQQAKAMPDWIIVGATVFLAIALLGTSAGYSAIGSPHARQIIPYGLLCLFMGGFILFDNKALAVAADRLIFQNVGYRVCMMLGSFEMCRIMLDHLSDWRRKAASGLISLLGAVDVLLAAASFSVSLNFYDISLLWIPVQGVVSLILIGFGIHKLAAYGLHRDSLLITHLIMHCVLIWELVNFIYGWLPVGGVIKPTFVMMFLVYLLVVTRRVVVNHAKAAKAEQLERQLTEERIATMISQIQPHFIYNTLGTIGHLCLEQPEKAAELVQNFAMYLRGNFTELDNLNTIRLTNELDHVRYYTEIERVRFPDMTVLFDIRCEEFSLPPLSVQPLVENAIKHGLMGLESGGTVKISSFETRTHYCVRVEDDGVGFDTAVLQDPHQHVGIRNIRSRLEAMCDGILTVESTPGVGTVATIRIPKQRRLML